MKVLLISDFDYSSKYGLISYFQNGLIEAGHETIQFFISPETIPKLTHSYTRTGLAIKTAYRLFNRFIHATSPVLHKFGFINLKKTVENFKPDFVIVIKGVMVTQEMLLYLKEKGIAIFNYYSDPIPLDNYNHVQTFPLYTCICTFHKDQIPSWYLLGAKNVIYLPFASDPKVHTPCTLSVQEKKYFSSSIAYLATWQPYVEYWPEKLLQYGLKIWGNQWYYLSKRSPLRKAWQGENVGVGEYFSAICSASEIIFNVVRAHNGQGHSMKTFEIPACMGFMLTNRTEEQLSFFPEDVAAVYFSTEEELTDKVRFYLNNEEKRKAISCKGYEIAQNHRYSHRMKTLIDCYKKL